MGNTRGDVERKSQTAVVPFSQSWKVQCFLSKMLFQESRLKMARDLSREIKAEGLRLVGMWQRNGP